MRTSSARKRKPRNSSRKPRSGLTAWIGSTSCRRHQLLRGSVGHALLPGPGRPGDQSPFPWVVSDFGLIDAIESGLVKIPQLAVRDTTGAEIPGYFNIWRWILHQAADPGGARRQARAAPKPEAILKWAHTPIAMLAGCGRKCARSGSRRKTTPGPPVFILVCKNTADRQGGLRLAGERQAAQRHPAGRRSKGS